MGRILGGDDYLKVIIDPGHGGKDKGGGSNSYWVEKDMNLKISLYQYRLLKDLGINVEMTRNKDEYLSPKKRSKIVRDSKADICISNHINNFTNSSPKGAEIIHSIYRDGKLAGLIMKELVKEGITKRRIFTKKHPYNSDKDYYFMNRKTGNVETVIVEYGFASNPEDTKKILKNWSAYATAVVRGVLEYLDIAFEKNVGLTPIIGESKSNILQMQNWARENNATNRFIKVAEKYIKYGEITGIIPEILYVQSAKETNFGKYTGVVTESMNNLAGIKVKKPVGINKDSHESFKSIDDGVRAHFNHISAYVGKKPIGKVHDRYYVVKSLSWAGKIKYVEELGGKWAPSKDYGKSIINNYLQELLNTSYDTGDYKELYLSTLKENEALKEANKRLREEIDN